VVPDGPMVRHLLEHDAWEGDGEASSSAGCRDHPR